MSFNYEHSNALPANFYGDPASVYERKEGTTCKGCAYEKAICFGVETVKVCDKGRKHGRKCPKYKETN